MKNLEIINKGDRMILNLNKKSFDDKYLIGLIRRLRIEELAQKSGYTSEIMDIAEEINEDWWNEYGDDFTKNIKK